MKPEDLNLLNYVILTGKSSDYHDASAISIHDAAYGFWLRYWRQTAKEIGASEDNLRSDDFLRHDFVNVLVFEDQPIAMINCTVVDFRCRASLDQSYVRDYCSTDFVRQMKALHLNRMTTLENIFADAAWRSKDLGLSLGSVVMILALKKMQEIGCDGAFGAARADAPTAKISYDMGAHPFEQHLTFHGKPTDLVFWKFDREFSSSHSATNALAQRLWKNKLDLSTQHLSASKIAA